MDNIKKLYNTIIEEVAYRLQLGVNKLLNLQIK